MWLPGRRTPDAASSTRSDHSVDQVLPASLERVEPLHPRVGPEPRLLAAHEPSGAQRGVGDGILDRCRAVDHREGLGVADRPARGAPLAQAEVDQPAGLVDSPAANIRAARSSNGRPGQRGPREADQHRGPHELAGRHRRAERAAGQGDHLERPHDPPPVVRLDRVGCCGVESTQLGEQGCDTLVREPRLEARPHVRVGRWDLEPVQGGAHVEPGPARHHGQRPAAQHGIDVGPRVPLVRGDAGLLGHVEHVELVVLDAVPLLRGDLGGADVHPAVELGGVGAHDLAPQPPGERDGEVGLAGGGRADHPDDDAVHQSESSSSGVSSSWPNGSRSSPGIHDRPGTPQPSALTALRALRAHLPDSRST